MIADRLRIAILQAAISGRLTEQRSEDGSAVELLEQITLKRNQLVREGRIKKHKRLSPVSEDEQPFALPTTWSWVRVAQIGSVVGGGTPKTTVGAYWGGETPWITPADLGKLDGRYVSGGSRTLTTRGLAESSARLLPARSVVMSSRAPIGHLAIAEVDLATNQGCKSLVLDLPTQAEFVFFALLSSVPRIRKLGTGTTFKEISGSTFGTVPLPLPPLAEQDRIVAKLNEVLPLIDQLAELEREREYLDHEFARAIERAILQAAISGKLTKQHPEDGTAAQLLDAIKTERAQLETEGKLKKQKSPLPVDMTDEPFDIPLTWQWARLGEIGSWAAGSTPSRSKPELYGGPIPWVKSGEVKHGWITRTEESITEIALSSCSVRLNPPGSVLVAMYGANIGDVGVLNIAAATNQAVCACIPFSGVESSFLKYMVQSSKDYLRDQGAGGAQPNISRAKLIEVPFPLPPLLEQKRIVAKLDAALPLVREIKELG